jgi:ribosome maturation factor RimP
MREQIVAQVTAIVERVGRSEGIEPVEVEWLGSGRRRMLRIFIDKPSGVSHADCEFVSRQVGTILDVEDVIPGGSYTLEVSSPGLERKLLRPKDYERFTGHKARIVLRQPIAGRRTWEGALAGLAEGVVTLAPGAGDPVRIPLDQVERANLKFDW